MSIVLYDINSTKSPYHCQAEIRGSSPDPCELKINLDVRKAMMYLYNIIPL